MEIAPNLGLGAEVAEVVLPCLATSIEHIHSIAPERWSLTPLHPGFRLNVGMLETFVVADDPLARVVVDVDLFRSSQQARALRNVILDFPEGGRYKKVPASGGVDVFLNSSSDLQSTLDLLRPSHNALLEKAARTWLVRNRKQGHRNVAVEQVGRAVGRGLPMPGWGALPHQPGDQGVKVSDVDSGQASEGGLREAEQAHGAIEGLLKESRLFTRSRSARLRRAAMDRGKGICEVCEVDFSVLLSGAGLRALQVHHKAQLALYDLPRVTRVEDLAVVCANCHSLLHLDPQETLTIEALRLLMRSSPGLETSATLTPDAAR